MIVGASCRSHFTKEMTEITAYACQSTYIEKSELLALVSKAYDDIDLNNFNNSKFPATKLAFGLAALELKV